MCVNIIFRDYNYNYKLVNCVSCLGLDTLTIDSMLYGTFKVKVDLNNESPEDICRKVSSATKLPTTHMQLYARKPER